ncbi:hypothetical protein EV198_3368 [Roseivirga ehrenbergii]|uniref:Uncharacterized protein n=1 Tax=Roseivirga ehrenbergii (strain DSM 102268 / JCM 13514 / KCTC 12282 / NCIMB 14502 / KMM 6017) TaxID=279360 RepID=A0A150WYQ0_ROSEK|nr:hypothetical protein [Roseivirga ehrenbergii]KYG71412.1 hypothetical protein MB14_11605 [Roseivirga ehrenbergii]TCK99540.1 hypothetical protein EV198_3368 [Roseivirga ehrenbergii]
MFVLIAIFFVAEKALDAQSSISGTYRSYFGEKLELRSDSTFIYNWKFDLASRWSIGEWYKSDSFIFLKVTPVYDTLRVSDGRLNKELDSLVLSADQSSGVITIEDFVSSQLSSGGQLTDIRFDKLFRRNNKLFKVQENGRLSRKRVRPIFGRKKRPTYFFRIKD